MLPNFVVIGAAKSGSTFLSRCLGEHPDVFLYPQEVAIFESPDWEEQGISSLQELLGYRTECRVGITRPSYVGKPEVPARIVQHLPKAHLIAILRNPIDRAISSYYHNMSYGFLPILDHELGMRHVLNKAYSKRYRRAEEILENGRYYKYLREYKYYLERGQLLVLLHDDLIQNPVETIQQAYRFLGLDDSYVPEALDTRPQAVIYNMSRMRLLSLRNNIAYSYNQDRTRLEPIPMDELGGHRYRLLQFLEALDNKVLAKVLQNRKPNLSQDLRNRLLDVYQSDIQELQYLLNRDLSHWQ
ncbi:MAG: sulfotransferase [Gemmataceae bacterium]